MTGTRQKQVKARAGKAFKLTKKLYEAAQKKVDEKADQLIDSLCKSSLEGNAQSTRLLVELAQGNGEAKEATEPRQIRSFALELASEPEWSGEQKTAASAVEFGSGKREAA
jgi:hypothetical protein